MGKIIPCEEKGPNSEMKVQNLLGDALEVFSQGELLVYPTETLYALGANPSDEKALNNLFLAKKRPITSPVSVGVADLAMMKELVLVNELAQAIYEKLLPGPVTMLLKAKGQLPRGITSWDNKVGIRIPDHTLALRIIKKVGPITATSANIHGLSEPRDIKTARRQLGDDVKLYIDCGVCKYQGPSTVVDLCDSNINIIREGVVSTKALVSIAEGL